MLTTSSTTLPELDLILEGEARKVTDEATLQHVAEAYRSTMDWPMEVWEGTVVGPNAPTAGPSPYADYELTPAIVYGLPGITGTEQGEGRAGTFSPTR